MPGGSSPPDDRSPSSEIVRSSFRSSSPWRFRVAVARMAIPCRMGIALRGPVRIALDSVPPALLGQPIQADDVPRASERRGHPEERRFRGVAGRLVALELIKPADQFIRPGIDRARPLRREHHDTGPRVRSLPRVGRDQVIIVPDHVDQGLLRPVPVVLDLPDRLPQILDELGRVLRRKRPRRIRIARRVRRTRRGPSGRGRAPPAT